MYYYSHAYFFFANLPISNNRNGDSHKKNCHKTGRHQVKEGRIYSDVYLIIST